MLFRSVSFAPSAPVITFSEFPADTVDPSIALAATSVGNVTVTFTGKTYTDTASDSNPVLGGHSGFFEAVSISFSVPVAVVGLKAGSFEALNSTSIEAFDENGGSLGFVQNTATGFQFFGLTDSSGANVIKSLTVYISGVEPAGFGIDTVTFRIIPPWVRWG